MRLFRRSMQDVWYAVFDKKEPVRDQNGHRTGESRLTYKPVQKLLANVSPARGYAQTEQFGTDLSYDRVVMTDDMTCPIDENTVMFIDKDPSFDENGSPEYDYVVKRVAKSKNVIAYAVRRVTS